MLDSFEAIARKLAQNETALAGLYELFERTFNEDAALWGGLARDEHQHAAWILHTLAAATPEQREQPSPQARVQAIERMISYVGTLADRCRRGELTRLTALALARDLENSLLEGNVLALIASATGRLAGLQADLIRATTAHRKRIIDALDELRGAR